MQIANYLYVNSNEFLHSDSLNLFTHLQPGLSIYG